MPAPKNSAANPYQESFEALASKGREYAANATRTAAEAVEAANGETLAFIDAAIEASKAKTPEQAYATAASYLTALGGRMSDRAQQASEAVAAAFPDFFAPFAAAKAK